MRRVILLVTVCLAMQIDAAPALSTNYDIELPSTLIGFLLLHLLPKVPILLMAVLCLRTTEAAVKDIEHGYVICHGEMCDNSTSWARRYLSYLRHPTGWCTVFRSAYLVSFSLFGTAAA